MKKIFNFLDEESTAQECFKKLFEESNPSLFSEFDFTNVRPNPDVDAPMLYGEFPAEPNTFITATLKNDSKFNGTTDKTSYQIEYDRCVPLDLPWWVRQEMVANPGTELDYQVWFAPGTTAGDLLEILALPPYSLRKTDVDLSYYDYDTNETTVLTETDPVPYDESSYQTQLEITAKPDSLIYRGALPVKFRINAGNLKFNTVILDKSTTQTAGPELTVWLALGSGVPFLFGDDTPMMTGNFDYNDPDDNGEWKENIISKVTEYAPAVLSDITTHQLSTFYARGFWHGSKSGTGGWATTFDSAGWGGYKANCALPYNVMMTENDYLKSIFYGTQYGASYNAVDTIMQLAINKANASGINIVERLFPDSRYPSSFDARWKVSLEKDHVLDGISFKEVRVYHPMERAEISVLVQNGITVKDHITSLIKNTGGVTVWGSYGVKGKIYCNPFSTLDNLLWYIDVHGNLKVKLDAYRMYGFLKGLPDSNVDMFHYETAIMLCLPDGSFTTTVSLTGGKLGEFNAFDDFYSATDHPFFTEKEYPEADVHCALTITMHEDSVFFKEGDTFTVSVTPVFNM